MTLETIVFAGLLATAGIVAAGLLLVFRGALTRRAIYVILPLNALADVLVLFTDQGGIHSGHVRAVLVALIVAAAVPLMRLDAVNAAIVVLLLYLLLLTLLSSNLGLSLNVYSKFALSLLMLPLARACIRTEDDLRRLDTSVLAGVAVFVVAFVVFQAFQLGIQIYRTGVYTAGGAKFTKFLAYAVILAPLMAVTGRGRLGWVRAACLGSATVVVLLVFHRSAILAVVAGYLVLYLYGFARSRVAAYGLAGAVGVVLFLLVLAPGYLDTLADLAARRASYAAMEAEMASEGGRVAETAFVSSTLREAGPLQLLFGTELFNGGELQGHLKQGVYRPLHVDYSIMLVGAGFVGFLLYALVYVQTARALIRQTRPIRATRFGRGVRATLWALLAASAIISASNQIWALAPLSLLFMYLGALLGVTRPAPRPAHRPAPRPVRAFRAAPAPAWPLSTHRA